MRCQALVRTGITDKKKRSRKGLRIFSLYNQIVHGHSPEAFPEERATEVEEMTCDGEIKVTVEARDEPDWGGHFAVLEIRYTCKNCGNTHFDELPRTSSELSKLLEVAIAGMPEEDRLTRLAEAKAEYDELMKEGKDV